MFQPGDVSLFFNDPSKRLFWMFLLSSLLWAGLWLHRRGRLSELFQRNYWWNRSSLLDLQLLLLNSAIRFVLVPLEALAVFHISRLWLLKGPSLSLSLSSSSIIALSGFTLMAFVVDDLFRFVQHLLMHRLPWLWRFHQVHHSAHTLNPLTLYRSHFVEVFVASFRRVLSLSVVSILFFVLSDGVLNFYQILGVNVLQMAFSLLGSNLRHSHIPISFGRFEHLLISPAQHQLHHAKNPLTGVCNYGVSFSVWDKLYGSWCAADSNQKIVFGINYHEKNHKCDLVSALVDPFALPRPMGRFIMRTTKAVALLLVTLFVGASSANTEEYKFQSRFKSSGSSVAYSGQVFRNTVLAEFKSFLGTLKRGSFPGDENEALYSLWSYVDFKANGDADVEGAINAEVPLFLIPKNLKGAEVLGGWAEGTTFGDVLAVDNAKGSNKDILGKMAGNDNPLVYGKLLGWKSGRVGNLDLTKIDADGKGDAFVEPEDLLKAWLMDTVRLSGDTFSGGPMKIENGNQPIQIVDAGYINEDGLDYVQLIDKYMMGAVGLSQAARDYLSFDLGPAKGLNADNTKALGSGKYTALEHHWDEAFGYYGAARDYLNYSDADIRTKGSIDTDGDGRISLNSEYNFGVAVTAAKIDLASESPKLQLNDTVFKKFVEGRRLISQQAPDLANKLKAIKKDILFNWEKALAGAAIHYVNVTVKEMKEHGTSAYLFVNHVKYWGELKGYALTFQFNPISPMSKADFIKLHDLIRDKPVLMSAGPSAAQAYIADLLKARDIMAKTYGFSKANAEAL